MANLADIYKKASLVMKPAAMKEGKLYSQQPHSGAGDFTFSRANGIQTRINEQGLIETVADNTPRLSYELDADGNVSECPTLLLEPTRTNLFSYSQDYSQSNWQKVNTTATDSQIVAPDGSLTGGKIQRTSTSGAYLQQVLSESTNGNYYSISCFVKKGNSDRVALRVQTNYPDRYDVRFVFSTESIEYSQAYADITNSSFNVVKYPNGWYRVEMTLKTASDNSQVRIMMSPRVTTGNVDSGDTSSDAFCYFWGAQLETSSNTSSGYSTSYVPTEGSSEQRNVDTAKVANFSDMPTDYPFTVFWQGRIDNINSTQFAFSILDIFSNVKYLGLSFSTTGYFQIHRRNSSYDVDSQTFSMSAGDVLKVAIEFISNTEYRCYINGSLIRNETSGASVDFDFNSILIGQQRVVSDGGTRNQASQFALFNEKLTDAELITLTT